MNHDLHKIVYDILETAKDGTDNARIIQNVNLNHLQLIKYLTLLEKGGFIEKEIIHNREIWETTEKGLDVIDACNICHFIVKENQIEE